MTSAINFVDDRDVLRGELLLAIGLADPEEGIAVGEIMRRCKSLQRNVDGEEKSDGKSRQTVWRKVSQACDDGLVEQVITDSRRNTVYKPSDALRRAAVLFYVRSRPASREKVGYDRSMLEDYVPNKSTYLRPSEIARLHTKCPPGTYKRGAVTDREMRRFMSDFAYASSKLEGVDYGLANTRTYFEDDQPLGNLGGRDRLVLMNHYEATRFLLEGIHLPAEEGDVAVTPFDIRGLHSILSNGLMSSPNQQGQMRMWPVKIEQTAYLPLENPQDIERYFNLALDKAREIADPFEQSMFLLVHLPYLQPFQDVNKRVARCSCNIPLLRAGVLPISWLDTDETEFKEALIAIYESREPRLLAELFTEACSRSFEHFALTRSEREPETIDLRYPAELKLAVRDRIEHDRVTHPRTVASEDAEEFKARVEVVLGSILENPYVGAAYGMRPPAVNRYCERVKAGVMVAAAPTPRAVPQEEDSASWVVEAMRA